MAAQWSLIIFTLFVCLAAGTFGAQGYLALRGKGNALQVPAVIFAFVALIIGGIASATHLQTPTRFFNGFLGNMASGISLELVAIAIAAIVMVVYFVLARKEAGVPKWMGALAIIVAIALAVIAGLSYLMPARPIWNNPATVLFFVANAVLLGGIAAWLFAGIKADDEAAKTSIIITLVGAVLSIVVALWFWVAATGVTFDSIGYYFQTVAPTVAPVDADAVSGTLAANYSLLFWGVYVVIGAVVPAILAFLKIKKGAEGATAFAGIALICALAGHIAYRYVFFLVGASSYLFF